MARERQAVSRESEYIPPAETVAPTREDFTVELTYIDLLDYLLGSARAGDSVEFRFPFYELDQETMEQGPRISEIYREFAVAGDAHFAPLEKGRQWSPREWRLKEFFRGTYSKGRWVFFEGTS